MIGAKELIEAFGSFAVSQLLTFDADRIAAMVYALAASGIEIKNLKIGAPSDFEMRTSKVCVVR